MREEGFVLIVSVIMAVLMSGLVGLAFFHVNQRWRLAAEVESQFHSHVLAENGLEYARHILPSLEINKLLVGPDGVGCGLERPDWRDPISLELARKLVLPEWEPGCDDGLLTTPRNGLGNDEEGFFLVRVSNNPEEDRFSDVDHILIVRSMGIVQQDSGAIFSPEIRNCVTVLEAKVRQERIFQPPSPLMIFGDGVEATFDGTEFLIEGGHHPAVTVVGISRQTAIEELLAAMTEEQSRLFCGRGETGSVEDGTDQYVAAFYSRLFQVSFWRHFVEKLPFFADSFPLMEGTPGFYFLPAGGTLEGIYEGVLVARGRLVLEGSVQFSGLLIHLGEGPVVFRDQARVRGGVWLSNLDYSTEELIGNDVALEISGSVRVIFDAETVCAALTALPATQLGWRIIFPEMSSG